MSEAVYETDLSGLRLFNRGKVRDIYDLGEQLLIVATDRLSAFDVVFPNPIPQKGRVLNQLTLFWLDRLGDVIPNHLISADLEQILKAAGDAGAEDPASAAETMEGRSMVVRKSKPFTIECVVRGYISGSMWKEYKSSGGALELYGHKLPASLRESDKLPRPIFTPATKATSGHDENISIQRAAEMVGPATFQKLETTAITLYERGRDIAAEQGLILADTKFEFGTCDDRIILIDEVLTPDSSRYWDESRYEPGRPQESFDKQYVRDWLEAQNWDKKPPAPQLPDEVVSGTTKRYLEAFKRITGSDLT